MGKNPQPVVRFSTVKEISVPEETDQARSFREYVEPEIEVMLRVAMSIAASPADAEDLVQESLLKAYRAIESFDGRHARAWLLTIMRNTNVSMHRRQRPITIDDAELFRVSRPAFGRAARNDVSAEDTFIDGELHPALDRAIRGLDSRFQEALILVDVHDLSYAEAAAVIGCPPGTVMSRLSRARERLRKALAPDLLPREETP